MPRTALSMIGLLALSACSFSASQTARTNGKGNYQIGVEPGALIGGVGGLGVAVGPQLDIGFRYGITDRADVGARLGTAGLELQYKQQLTGDDGVIVSVAPALTGFFGAVGGVEGGFVSLPVSLLVDVPVGESALVLGPRVHPTLALGGGQGGFGLNVGASVGFAAKLSDGFKLMPDVAVSVPVSGGGLVTQAKLNFLVGKTK